MPDSSKWYLYLDDFLTVLVYPYSSPTRVEIMAKHQEDYIAYLLRLWRTEHKGQWKASLEDPYVESRIGFGSIQALCVFLLERFVHLTQHTVKQKGVDDERKD